MIPEKELIRREYQVRDLRLPTDTKLTRQSMLRWVCLSLGLLSPDETRQSILPVLDSFIAMQVLGQSPSVAELSNAAGQPEKVVRYHLQRLEAIGLVEEEKRHYKFVMDSSSNRLSLAKTFKQHYSETLIQSLSSVELALAELQRSYEG